MIRELKRGLVFAACLLAFYLVLNTLGAESESAETKALLETGLLSGRAALQSLLPSYILIHLSYLFILNYFNCSAQEAIKKQTQFLLYHSASWGMLNLRYWRCQLIELVKVMGWTSVYGLSLFLLLGLLNPSTRGLGRFYFIFLLLNSLVFYLLSILLSRLLELHGAQICLNLISALIVLVDISLPEIANLTLATIDAANYRGICFWAILGFISLTGLLMTRERKIQ